MDVTVLQSIDWEVLVVDEAHRLKNNQSKVGGKRRGGEGGREGVWEWGGVCFVLLFKCDCQRGKVMTLIDLCDMN